MKLSRFKNRRPERAAGGGPGDNRINLVMAVIFLLGASTLYKLYDLQWVKYDLYSALASSQHEFLGDIEPARGGIFMQGEADGGDNSLFPLAANKKFGIVYAVPKDIENPDEAAEKIYEIFDKEKAEKEVDDLFAREDADKINGELAAFKELSDEEREEKREEVVKNYQELLSGGEYAELRKAERELKINAKKDEKIAAYKEKFSKENDPYEPIANKVDEDKLKEIDNLGIKGIAYMMADYRYYPENNISSHIAGFVGYDEDKMKGFYGLEGFFNEELTGKKGVLKAEKDANRHLTIINDREFNEQVDGSDLILTINRPIQFTACEKLDESVRRHGADSGTVIIIDPKTGAIIAMCSSPDYDPNNYDETDTSVFNNPAIFAQYEPGSVFKTITMAAAIDSGKLLPDSTYEDKGFVNVKGWPKPIKNSDYETAGGHGVVDMNTVLEMSLNTGAIYAANKIGDKAFSDYARQFGFGEKTGIELETEATGDINNLLVKNIKPVDAAVASFGQGIAVTPLQMVMSYAAIANGGILMKPYLVKEIISPDGVKTETAPKQVRRAVSERTALLVSGMLTNVVEKGHSKRAQIDGYYVAGKTGTAQVADSARGGYGGKTIHTFVGFAPTDDPEFVMLVRLDNPKDAVFAESTSVPLFKDIAEFILNYWQVEKERK